MKPTSRIYVRDRTATRPNRHEIDHRNQNRVTTDVGIPRVHDLNLTIWDSTDIGRRATDINRNHVPTATGQTL